MISAQTASRHFRIGIAWALVERGWRFYCGADPGGDDLPNIPKTATFAFARLLAKSLSYLDAVNAGELGRIFANTTGPHATESLHTFARAFAQMRDNFPNLLEANGEAWLIQATGKLGFRTIVDTGANRGDWTRLAAASHPEATIHCFEIVPDTFKTLEAELAGLGARAVLNPIGLSDTAGTVPVHIGGSSYIASMLDFAAINGRARPTVECTVATLDAYAANAGLDRIDFLKIDVEGAEAQVLNGAKELLGAGRIRLVQFEYNRGAIVSGFLLRHFYEMLVPLGYRLGRLMPAGVRFHAYELEDENFIGPNYVAVLGGEIGIIDAIAVR